MLDSYDAALFRHEYKDWGIELPEIVTATAFVDELIKAGKLAVWSMVASGAIWTSISPLATS